jgi:hypothetical protein
MINHKFAKKYCREDISLIKNYQQAIIDKEHMWECHHINELTFTAKELKKMNMYYNRPSSELVFLTKAEHKKLHYSVCAGSKEHKRKIGEAHKGNQARKGKIRSGFGIKFKEHFGISCSDNLSLYRKENDFYRYHNKCSWEK